MKDVHYNAQNKEFLYKDENEQISSFEYHPSTTKLWDPISLDKFAVDLCINPYLSRELDIFELRYLNKRCGYIFPISLLDTKEDLTKYNHLNSYIFIAFSVLLQRIKQIKKYNLFSDNFEDNLCVCILNLDCVPQDVNGINGCIHILRYYGYSYFHDKNMIHLIPDYNAVYYYKSNHKIDINFTTPKLYSDPIIIELLEIYPKIDNLAHRFVILYQFIEYLMADTVSTDIEYEIHNYHTNRTHHNDFITKISTLNSEHNRIKIIFERCNIKTEIKNDFETSCKNLFDLINYNYKDKNNTDKPLATLFYSFRNQMTHSFRKLHHHTSALGETIQNFERVVLNIIATYE